MYIDTHAHLYLEQFNEDIDEVIQRAQDNDVRQIFLPNIDSTTQASMIELCTKNPNMFFPLTGLHPCSVKENYLDELSMVKESLAEGKYFGIGETGIDLYWDKSFKKEQIRAFEFQIELAIKHKLPIIIHSRESLDLNIEIITAHKCEDLKGIFHCFNGNTDQYNKIAELNFCIGLGGVITFKNAGMDNVLKDIDLYHTVLETDSPYLSPVPHRGKRNESSYIPLIAQKISEIKDIPVGLVAEETTKTAKRIYLLES